MKQSIKIIGLFIVVFAASTQLSMGQQSETNSLNTKAKIMKTYVIERELPGAGSLTPADLRGVAQKSNAVLKKIGPSIEWQSSYVTGNKLYCVYKAENAELIRQHAKEGGFPCNSVQEVVTTIGPTTGE